MCNCQELNIKQLSKNRKSFLYPMLNRNLRNCRILSRTTVFPSYLSKIGSRWRKSVSSEARSPESFATWPRWRTRRRPFRFRKSISFRRRDTYLRVNFSKTWERSTPMLTAFSRWRCRRRRRRRRWRGRFLELAVVTPTEKSNSSKPTSRDFKRYFNFHFLMIQPSGRC